MKNKRILGGVVGLLLQSGLTAGLLTFLAATGDNTFVTDVGALSDSAIALAGDTLKYNYFSSRHEKLKEMERGVIDCQKVNPRIIFIPVRHIILIFELCLGRGLWIHPFGAPRIIPEYPWFCRSCKCMICLLLRGRKCLQNNKHKQELINLKTIFRSSFFQQTWPLTDELINQTVSIRSMAHMQVSSVALSLAFTVLYDVAESLPAQVEQEDNYRNASALLLEDLKANTTQTILTAKQFIPLILLKSAQVEEQVFRALMYDAKSLRPQALLQKKTIQATGVNQ